MKFMRRAESAIDLDAEVKNAASAKKLLFSILGCWAEDEARAVVQRSAAAGG